jgi:hypothetical protein
MKWWAVYCLGFWTPFLFVMVAKWFLRVSCDCEEREARDGVIRLEENEVSERYLECKRCGKRFVDWRWIDWSASTDAE